MSKPPPSKKELDRINAEIKRLESPKTPEMTPRPGGSMRRQATAVEIQVRKDRIDHLKEQRDQMVSPAEKDKSRLRRDFDRER